MGMTMSQQILAAHSGGREVKAGEYITASLDLVLGNDVTTPVAINAYERVGLRRVFDRKKVVLVMDHFTPNKDIKSAEQVKRVRTFARDKKIEHYFEGGGSGVEHALLPEKGLVTPGDLVIGADSHTCTYGALGAFSTGIGSTDMAGGMVYGKVWLKVPAAMRFNLTGTPKKYVSGKDVILHIIGRIGVDGALYKSMEFSGGGVQNLTMDDRLCICNMAIEAGAKNGIFPADDAALAYARERSAKEPRVFAADPDAVYDSVTEIDLGAVECSVAFPHLPSNVKVFGGFDKIRIDQAVIGSCTNGRLSDMAAAAEVFKGRNVASGVRAIVIPATHKNYSDALDRGYLKIFAEAGCVISAPTCGPCLGGHMGILAAGERCVATTNRNFVGRMGHPESEVYLSNPYVAAASAITGRLTHPQELLG